MTTKGQGEEEQGEEGGKERRETKRGGRSEAHLVAVVCCCRLDSARKQKDRPLAEGEVAAVAVVVGMSATMVTAAVDVAVVGNH